jgi:hypothetical protein
MAPDQARALGQHLGVDVLMDSEVTINEDSSLGISCQALHIVSGRILASSSIVVEGPTAAKIKQQCTEMMVALLKVLRNNWPDDGGTVKEKMLAGVEDDIRRQLLSHRANTKWNQNKNTVYNIEVDFAGINIVESKQYEYPLYVVTGSMAIVLSDTASRAESVVDVDVKQFTEMTPELIKKNINEQVRPQVAAIIRDLLSRLQ